MDDAHEAGMPDDAPEARFGAELRRLRLHAGLSVRELAKGMHRVHSTISDFENGRRLPTVEVVEQYEDYFGLSRGTLGAHRERARVQRLEAPRDGTLVENLGDVTCPYMGLRAFEAEDAALFFGRESQIEAVLARLLEKRFVAVVGASGAGKSSFVRAGLIAAIRAAAPGNSSPRVVVLTPGEHPLHQLAGAVGSGEDGIGTDALADELRADPGALRRVTSHAGDAPLVVAVDQFEELFTLCRDEPERRCFVDALIAAWRDPSSPVVVIVALRADFYGHAAAYPELADAVVAHQTLLGALSAADLRRVIELPAARSGLLLQPGLVETMLDDLGEEPGALPLLSHALLETWKRRSRLLLTVDGYRKAGGMRAIAQTAEHTLQLLSEQDRSIARLIFLSLTEVGEGSEPTRRRMDREELSAASRQREAAERVLGILADARLVSVDERTVVVAHEALIRHWPRLRGWIDDDREGLLIHRRLTEAAREWKHLSRDPGALYRGARLAAAREWATDLNVLSPLERAFLTASESVQRSDLKAAKRTTRRLRAFATGLAVLSLVFAERAGWALHQRSTAQHQLSEAQRREADTTSLYLQILGCGKPGGSRDPRLLNYCTALRRQGIPDFNCEICVPKRGSASP